MIVLLLLSLEVLKMLFEISFYIKKAKYKFINHYAEKADSKAQAKMYFKYKYPNAIIIKIKEIKSRYESKT